MSQAAQQIMPGVLVVGGGYAGLHAVRAVESAGVEATVLDPESQHSFVARLASVAGGSVPESDASMPLSALVAELIVGRAAEIGDGWVRLDDGRTLHAEAVVVTAGAEPTRPPIPGLDLAATLRTAEDARRLRDRIAEAEALVVVGGGASGVQLAGAAARTHDLPVHLVEAGPALLPGMAATVGRNAERILRQRGVQVHLNTTVEEISQSGVRTAAGEIPGLVVWTGGFAADAGSLGLPTDEHGRVLVAEDLSVPGMDRTFAAGDIAAHLDAAGQPLPMSAQVAVRAGTAAGRNAARRIAGQQTRPVRLAQLGWVLDLGGGRGLAEFGLPLPTLELAGRRLGPSSLPLAGPLLDRVPPLLHDGIDTKNVLEIAGASALLPWHERFAAWPGGALTRGLGRLAPLVPRPRPAGSEPDPAA